MFSKFRLRIKSRLLCVSVCTKLRINSKMAAKPPDMDNWHLAVINMWMNAGVIDVPAMIVKHFDHRDLEDSVVNSLNDNILTNYQKSDKEFNYLHVVRPQSGVFSDLAQNIVTSIKRLKEKNLMPKLKVSSDDLHRLPGITKTGVEAVSGDAVVARLESLEQQNADLLQLIHSMKDTQQVVSQQLQQLQQLANKTVVPTSTPTNGATLSVPPASFGGVRTRTNVNKSRSVSPSVKRPLEDSESNKEKWNEVVKRKRKPAATKGSSSVNILGSGSDKIFAHYDVYIANTHPESTDKIIEEVLTEIANNMPEGLKLNEKLKILEIECQSKQTPGVKLYSKSWRVRVENKFKEHMCRPEAIPAGWTSRKFYPKREPRKLSDLNPLKRPAIGSGISAAAGGDLRHNIPGL